MARKHKLESKAKVSFLSLDQSQIKKKKHDKLSDSNIEKIWVLGYLKKLVIILKSLQTFCP